MGNNLDNDAQLLLQAIQDLLGPAPDDIIELAVVAHHLGWEHQKVKSTGQRLFSIGLVTISIFGYGLIAEGRGLA